MAASQSTQFDELIARDYPHGFPILQRLIHGRPLVYLDNAATSQKPWSVIDAEERYYAEHNANVHRGIHRLSQEATDAFEGARDKVRAFIGAVLRVAPIDDRGELIVEEFTRLLGPRAPPSPFTTRGPRSTRCSPASTRWRLCSHEPRPARSLSGDHHRPRPAAAQFRRTGRCQLPRRGLQPAVRRPPEHAPAPARRTHRGGPLRRQRLCHLHRLGLLYGHEVDAAIGRVAIRMTLTAPGCPVAQTFPEQVANTVGLVAGVEEVTVDLVWEPTWTRERMSQAARLELGMM